MGCTRSSMDRIPDSGSDDMSSILIGRTIKRADVFNKTSARFLFIIKINAVLCKDLLECLGISVKLIIFTELI